MGNRYYRSVEKPLTAAERTARYRKKYPERRRGANLKWKYGITEAEWNSMFEAQNSSCKICETTEPGGKGWHTDHDHDTGIVRGILCNLCNVGLGHFKDNPSLLAKASNYLQRSRVT